MLGAGLERLRAGGVEVDVETQGAAMRPGSRAKLTDAGGGGLLRWAGTGPRMK